MREAFVRLYEKGLIYRGPRLVNWSPGLRTAVSDVEVEYSEEEAKLYYFKYMLADKSGEYIPVATIRPETILGDTAVAVHPEDDRYKKFVGKKVVVPVLGREIPVIADDYVSREFGTGALKITPGHDPNDYAIAQRHNLPVISVLDAAAAVNENGGPYAGMDRYDCRDKLWADMLAAGLVIKTEPYTTTIPRSQRGGEIIEPMISTQWFVNVKPQAEKALEAVKNGDIHIVPDHFDKVYYNWMENIDDWCISRQLWWGHRIPVWYCEDCGKQTCTREDPTECAHCGSRGHRTGPRRARHLVLIRAVAVLNAGLAGEDSRPEIFLSDHHHGDWLRHPVLLGGAHDHGRAGVHGRYSFPHRVPARPDPRRARAEDVENARATWSTRWTSWMSGAPTRCASPCWWAPPPAKI